MKFISTISCLLGLVLSQSKVHDDLCIIGPSVYGGGQYEYKGVDADGKPYYQQKDCIRPYPAHGLPSNGDVKIAGGRYLSFVKDANKYYISNKIGEKIDLDGNKADGTPWTEDDFRQTYCSSSDIDSPLDCKAWTVTGLASGTVNGEFNFGVYEGNCPDVLGDDNTKFTGINAKFPDNYEGGDIFKGDYTEIGLNMFKKVQSTTTNTLYLYFDPYYFQWRFIGSYTGDEKSWKGADPDHLTCPAYSKITEPYLESYQRGGWPTVTNINEVFQQFTDNTLSYKVPLPWYYPDNKYDPNVKATEFMTLTAIKA